MISLDSNLEPKIINAIVTRGIVFLIEVIAGMFSFEQYLCEVRTSFCFNFRACDGIKKVHRVGVLSPTFALILTSSFDSDSPKK